jgi:gas vesicle protein
LLFKHLVCNFYLQITNFKKQNKGVIMATDGNKTAKGLLIGFIAGSVVGAIIALLYAPKPGKELRADIKNDAEEYLKIAKQKAVEIIHEGKRQSETLITEAKNKAATILADAEKLITNVRDKTSEEGKKLKEAVQAGVEAYKKEKS